MKKIDEIIAKLYEALDILRSRGDLPLGSIGVRGDLKDLINKAERIKSS